MAKMNPKRSLDRMAGLGRMGDSELAHVTPGEMVVPRQVLARDPGLARHAAKAIASAGADPRQYVVGHPRNSRNPRSGAKEYALQEIAFDPTHYATQYSDELARAGVDASDPNAMWRYYDEVGRDLAQTANVYEQGAQDAGYGGTFSGNWGKDIAGTSYDPTSSDYSGGDFNLPSYYHAQNVDYDYDPATNRDNGGKTRAADKNAGDIQGWWNNTGTKLTKDQLASYNNYWSGDRLSMNPYDMAMLDQAVRNGTVLPNDPVQNMTWADLSDFYHRFGYAPNNKITGGYYPIEGMPEGVFGGTENVPLGSSGVPQSFAAIDMLSRFSPQQLATLARQNPAGTGLDPYSSNMLDFLYGRGTDVNVYSGHANSGPGRPSGGWDATIRHTTPGALRGGDYLVKGANGAATVSLDDLANGKISLQAVQRALDSGANLPAGATMYSMHPADLAKIDPAFSKYLQPANGMFDPSTFIFDDRLPTDYYTNPASPGYFRSAKAGENSQSVIDSTPEMITRAGAPFQLFRHKDGTVVDGEGWAYAPHTFPGGQQGYFDTYYGMYRLGNGTIVDAQGQPIITQFNQHIGGSYDPLKVYGSNYINSLGLPSRDSPPNGEGGPRPYTVGPYGNSSMVGPGNFPVGSGTPESMRQQTGMFSGGTGQPTAGGWPVPVTPGATGPNGTTTGTGLIPGQPNPYSYPYAYNPYVSPYGTGGINLNIFGGQQQTSGQTPGSTTATPSFPYSLLNAGYQMTPGGFPMWTSNYGTDPNATGGGLNYAQPNSETVDYRSPFAY